MKSVVLKLMLFRVITVNRACYKMFSKDIFFDIHPMNDQRKMLLLFDSTHNLKNNYNSLLRSYEFHLLFLTLADVQ